MNKVKVKIKFLNGLNFETFKNEVFDINGVSDGFEFEESENPEFIIFGPYGNDIPPRGDYTRIGYFCENMIPDMDICEWAFGIPLENEIKHPKYKRIQWHGLNPASLIKDLSDNDIDQIINQKKSFCNFLYSHQVPYREEFFRQLSKYKKVDAPGKSMNNMSSIDSLYSGDVWERKREFLSQHKFTIAFENYAYPGYQTEKLYDAMRENSLPIYCGDNAIGETFNTKSFLNSWEFIKTNNNKIVGLLEKYSQLNFVDIRPQFFRKPSHRITRKLKAIGREIKMNCQFNKLDFSPLIDRIIEIDNNEDLYIQYLKEPWFNNNRVPSNTSSKKRWTEIFLKKNDPIS